MPSTLAAMPLNPACLPYPGLRSWGMPEALKQFGLLVPATIFGWRRAFIAHNGTAPAPDQSGCLGRLKLCCPGATSTSHSN